MAQHEEWIQARIDQIEEMLDAGWELSEMVVFLNTDGFWQMFDGKDTTEDFVFKHCLSIIAKRMEAKQRIEQDFDVSDEGFDPYSNCYTDDC